MSYSLSDRLRHFFHVVSNIRPIFWIGLYVCLTPIFATIYWALPDGQFRIPDNAGTDWGSWFYYSIVTITTLGFGDYTPAHGWAQAVTAIEVMCGLVFLGFFLNAVGSMKSEIDVESEIEKQKRAHFFLEKEKLIKSFPSLLHSLNLFLDFCWAATTPIDTRKTEDENYNPDFKINDLRDLFKPSGLEDDHSGLPVVSRLMKSASQSSIALDSLQSRVDLTLWPDLLEDCFAFVANFQLFSNTDILFSNPLSVLKTKKGNFTEKDLSSKIAALNDIEEISKPQNEMLQPVGELFYFIKQNANLAQRIETIFTEIERSV